MFSSARTVGSLFMAYVGIEILGRAALCATTVALGAASRLTLWTARRTFSCTCSGLRIAARFAADYLETSQDIRTGKLLRWSEVDREIIIEREEDGVNYNRIEIAA